jgi:hypothetical protein
MIELQSMALDLPPVEGHPNRLAFRGVLTLLDSPSDRAPAGARGHRVLLTRAAAERALPSLLGMGLDYASGLDRHEPRRKVGIITEAEIRPSAPGPRPPASNFRPTADGREPTATLATLTIAGYLFARDFPDVVRELRVAGRLLGMSYEITDARIADMRAPIWTITEFTFTGAAVLRRDKAAYRQTWIELTPRLEPRPEQHSASQPSLN